MRTFWICLLIASVVVLAACATTPEQAAGIGAASVAAFDAALNSLVSTKTIDPGNAMVLSNGVHSATDAATGAATAVKNLLDVFNAFRDHTVDALAAGKQMLTEQVAAANEGATVKATVAAGAGGGLGTSITHLLRGPARKAA